jgi:hypothetical protein
LGGGVAAAPAAGAAAKLRAWFGKGRRATDSSSSGNGSGYRGSEACSGSSAAVVKPEFLVFRDVTSAVLAQVGLMSFV